MKTTLLIIAALATTMIVLPVEAQPQSGADVMCSKNSIAASRLWLKKETDKATELRATAKRPKPERGEYWFGQRYREEMLIWLADQQLAATANQSVILANRALEGLILDCAIWRRLGYGA